MWKRNIVGFAVGVTAMSRWKRHLSLRIMFPEVFLYDFAEEDTAVIILFSTELFRVKHRRDSEKNFFAASSLKSRPQYAFVPGGPLRSPQTADL